MDRRDDQNKDRSRDFRNGNRDMGQSRESMYRGAYRFDDSRTTRDQYGDARHGDDRGQAHQHYTQGASRNFGNMGSYGGAQGFGSSRGGYGHPSQEQSGFDATSGHGHDDRYHAQTNRPVYGGYWDRNSFNENDKDRFSQAHRSRHQERNRYNQYDQNRQDDSRYEIYDTHQRQFNEGSYNNDVRMTPSYGFNRNMGGGASQGRDYDSLQRAKNRQRQDQDQDRGFTSGLQEDNMSSSLSWGYDGGYRGDPDAGGQERYYPMGGQVRRRDHPEAENYRRDDRNRARGGYDANNMSPDEGFKYR